MLLLEFIYKGDVKIEGDELERFLELGQLLKIKGLEERGGLIIEETKDEDIVATQKCDTLTRGSYSSAQLNK